MAPARLTFSAGAGAGRATLALVLAAAAALVLPLPGADACKALNWVINAGAESVTRTGVLRNWIVDTGNTQVESGGDPHAIGKRYGSKDVFPNATVSRTVRGSRNFFYGGQNVVRSTLYQEITKCQNNNCRSPGRKITVRGWLGGLGSQDDSTTVTVTYLDKDRNSLGSFGIGPVTAADRGSKTGLLFRENSMRTPCGTVTIRLAMTFVRAHGTSNDGYADNLEIRQSNA